MLQLFFYPSNLVQSFLEQVELLFIGNLVQIEASIVLDTAGANVDWTWGSPFHPYYKLFSDIQNSLLSKEGKVLA